MRVKFLAGGARWISYRRTGRGNLSRDPQHRLHLFGWRQHWQRSFDRVGKHASSRTRIFHFANSAATRGYLVGRSAYLNYGISQMVEPRATYRVQLHSGFTFDDAADISEYLAELGISHLYCSPSLRATPGSTHGYDVVDHRRVNEDLGG